jgi:pimeloyl-ACP methyl ester carboxylesterase
VIHITVPTLVIATPEDPTNPASNSRHLAENLPRSAFVILEGMGHAIPKTVVPRLTAAILDHLAAVEGDARRESR